MWSTLFRAILQVSVKVASSFGKKALTKEIPLKGIVKKIMHSNVKDIATNKAIGLVPKEIRVVAKLFDQKKRKNMLISQLQVYKQLPFSSPIESIAKRYRVMSNGIKRWEKRMEKWEQQAQRKENSLAYAHFRERMKRDDVNKRLQNTIINRHQKNQQAIALAQIKKLRQDAIKGERVANQMIKDSAKEQARRDEINSKLAQKIYKGIWDKDWIDYKTFFFSLSEDEKKSFVEILETQKEMYIVYNSSWIKFATFTPYYKINKDYEQKEWNIRDITTGNTRGVMTLQMKKSTKKNPLGIYSWINISYATWLKISSSPDGTNFWKAFYRINRKNIKHLTDKSIYYKKRKYNKKSK